MAKIDDMREDVIERATEYLIEAGRIKPLCDEFLGDKQPIFGHYLYVVDKIDELITYALDMYAIDVMEEVDDDNETIAYLYDYFHVSPEISYTDNEKIKLLFAKECSESEDVKEAVKKRLEDALDINKVHEQAQKLGFI